MGLDCLWDVELLLVVEAEVLALLCCRDFLGVLLPKKDDISASGRGRAGRLWLSYASAGRLGGFGMGRQRCTGGQARHRERKERDKGKSNEEADLGFTLLGDTPSSSWLLQGNECGVGVCVCGVVRWDRDGRDGVIVSPSARK